MTETIKQKLARLLAENPELPIKVQVDQQITSWQECAWMMADLNSCRVAAYHNDGEYIHLRDDCEMLEERIAEQVDDRLSTVEFNRIVEERIAALDWKPCILLEVGP